MTATTRMTRRARATAEITARTGIDEDMIARLIDGFYGRVREDPVLGPIFESEVRDWDVHLARMRAFWSSVALLTGRYHGQPMQAHMRLPVDGRHFDHWLTLFEKTARDLCPPEAAELFIDRANRIAQSLELGVASASGVMLAPGERFIRDEAETVEAGRHVR